MSETLSEQAAEEIHSAYEQYHTALRNWLIVVERHAPYAVGDMIPENDYEDHPPMMVIEKIWVEPSGVVGYAGKQVSKSGQPGKRTAIRRINLLHLLKEPRDA